VRNSSLTSSIHLCFSLFLPPLQFSWEVGWPVVSCLASSSC
jgi:hypothetical protein